LSAAESSILAMQPTEPIFVDGKWRDADAFDTFRAVDPTTGEAFGPAFPRSRQSDIGRALRTSRRGDAHKGTLESIAQRSTLLRAYADNIDAAKVELATIAERETGLPAVARFQDVEIPRTIDQLRQAADCVDRRDWQLPTIDTKRNVRSCLHGIGTVAIFGPANFPFAYNAIAGGDFASAFAAGCRVIARAHPSHPNTTKRLAELLEAASHAAGYRSMAAELLYDFSNEDGLWLAKDARLAAIGFTGSRAGGLALKAAADATGVAFFGELSSVNPVAITAAALIERGDAIADEYVASVLLAGGQMCTNPGLVFVEEGPATQAFVDRVVAAFRERPPAVLLNERIWRSLERQVAATGQAGAKLLRGGNPSPGGFRFENTLFEIDDQTFLKKRKTMQAEMFGNAALFVRCKTFVDADYALIYVGSNLTGSIYFAAGEAERPPVQMVTGTLRRHVGRLLTNAMPTGVAVSPAMNHGGPWPASTSASATAVGFPAAIRRFTKLDCYDRVVPELLPDVLKDENPTGATRLVDGRWTSEPIGASR
jgi:alpha-ketoglutaric semialdehyde dehydrogenase